MSFIVIMSTSREQRDYINPGPYDGSLLRLQETHRSTKIWWSQQEHNDSYFLECKRGGGFFSNENETDPRIIENLRETGFFGMTQLKSFQIDWHLITALVERWRPETHTFHFPDGECTVTLQDVEVLTGLPVDGNALIGPGNHKWRDLCESLLGLSPPSTAIRGCMLKLTWLRDNFGFIPDNAENQIIDFHTRATMLLIIVEIFCDKNKGRVNLQYLPFLRDIGAIRNYSWGGACFAYLYRELCDATKIDNKSISGPLFLLQMWAWERIRCVSPRLRLDVFQANAPYGARWKEDKIVHTVDTHVIKTIRYRFDRMDSDGFKWQPYTNEIIEALPQYCRAGRDIWTARVPLICICIVEWHLPDRVLRQFGFDQPIPGPPDPPPSQSDLLHACDFRRTEVNWETEHAFWINKWNLRRTKIVAQNSIPLSESLHFHAQYMEWYRRVTRRWMSIQGAGYGVMADGLERLSLLPDRNTQEATSVLEALIGVGAQERRVTNMAPPHRAPQAGPTGENDQENDIGTSNTRRRRRAATQRTRFQAPERIPGPVVPEPVTYHYPYYYGESSSQPSQATPSAGPSFMPYASHHGMVQSLGTQTFSRPHMYSQSLDSPWQVHTPANTVYPPFGQGSFPTHNEGGSSSQFEETQLNDENVGHGTPFRARRPQRPHNAPNRFTPSNFN